MATDVTSNEVLTLIGEGASSEDVTAQINAAELIVAEDLSSSGLSDARKRLITLYLAAHFATLSLKEGGYVSIKVGESTDKYEGTGSSEQGILSTKWGQLAVSLDTTGTLAENAVPKIKSEFRVV